MALESLFSLIAMLVAMQAKCTRIFGFIICACITHKTRYRVALSSTIYSNYHDVFKHNPSLSYIVSRSSFSPFTTSDIFLMKRMLQQIHGKLMLKIIIQYLCKSTDTTGFQTIHATSTKCTFTKQCFCSIFFSHTSEKLSLAQQSQNFTVITHTNV